MIAVPDWAHPANEGDRGSLFEFRGIVKRFGSLTALDGVDLALATGEVHALLGENGAGKSTLMNIMVGALHADRGEILKEGSPATPASPREAYELGIGMVHQDFKLIDGFSVAENIHVGWQDTPLRFGARTLRSQTQDQMEKFGFSLDPDAYVFQLSVGERQRVAILRALVRGAQVLILDEPTAALTPVETEELFESIRRLRAAGHTVVFISHKLNEVMDIADRVSVLRGGRRIATHPIGECDPPMLGKLMVGHEVRTHEHRAPIEGGEKRLVLRDIYAVSDRGTPALTDISLELRSGEILGVAGVAGNGQPELAEIIAGIRTPSAGTIEIDGLQMTGSGARSFALAGVGFVPEDLRTGLALDESIEYSAAIRNSQAPPIRVGPFIDRNEVRRHSQRLLEKANLASINPARSARTLSGGQAQRLLFRRELNLARRLLVAAHPARGLDIDATMAVYEALFGARDQMVGVVLISEDLEELFALSDRIVVLYRGAIVGEFRRSDFDRDSIGLRMGGVT